jgi:hypothetical protein
MQTFAESSRKIPFPRKFFNLFTRKLYFSTGKNPSGMIAIHQQQSPAKIIKPTIISGAIPNSSLDFLNIPHPVS